VECRWILKMDYLTDSSQEGKLLAEEPYEWHRNGLSEDGAINMEAPRKWRLVKEKTGHGAFYGMRIVVYGDCIAPPLVCFVFIENVPLLLANATVTFIRIVIDFRDGLYF